MDYKLRSESLSEFAPALIKFQSEVDSIKKNRKGVHGSSYADFDALIKEVTPNLINNDLSVYIGRSYCIESKRIMLHTTILHKSDQWIKSITPLFWDEDDRKEINQKIGTANSYQKRYDLANLLGLSIVDDNDDNDGYEKTEFIKKVRPSNKEASLSEKQIKLLNYKSSNNKDEVLKKLGIKSFNELTMGDMDSVLRLIEITP